MILSELAQSELTPKRGGASTPNADHRLAERGPQRPLSQRCAEHNVGELWHEGECRWLPCGGSWRGCRRICRISAGWQNQEAELSGCRVAGPELDGCRNAECPIDAGGRELLNRVATGGSAGVEAISAAAGRVSFHFASEMAMHVSY